MRRISAELADGIRDALAEGLVGYSDVALEKDVHISAVLKLVAQLAGDDYSIVFCGGTSLVKAYRLIDRMSEDIDLKVVLAPGLSKNAQRTLLRQLRDECTQLLNSSDFEVTEPISENNNSHIEFTLAYESVFGQSRGLRAGIKLEFTQATLSVLPQRMTTTTLIGDVLPEYKDPVDLLCLTLEETMAEKVVSFLRRTLPYFRDTPGQYEDQLVRHVYDVYKLAECSLDFTTAKGATHAAYTSDSQKFKNTSELFAREPRSELLFSLGQLNEAELAPLYSVFVSEFLGRPGPDFKTALAVFTSSAHGLLE